MTLDEQKLIWAAEDANELAIGQARRAYYDFTGTLDVRVVDEAADHENCVDEKRDSLAYWELMTRSAQSAAVHRTEELEE